MSDTRMYALVKGRGEGCDYTVGCNVRIDRLKANTIEEAIAEACGDVWGEYDEDRIEKITILRVTEEVDCAPRIAELIAKRKMAEQAAATKAKRAHLEALKRELGET